MVKKQKAKVCEHGDVFDVGAMAESENPEAKAAQDAIVVRMLL